MQDLQASYDILITGAGPAGCAAAYDLACAGKRVLLLDKRNFPRPKPCACGLTRKALKALRYSVDPVVERVCHEIVLQPADNTTEVRVKTRTPICAMAVRERFDDFCLKQTLASARNGGSVVLRKIERITALRESLTHVELDIVTADGLETLCTSILIGADGSNGQTRHLHRQDTHGEAPTPSAQDSVLKGAGFSPSVETQREDGALAPGGTLDPPPNPTWYSDGFALEATVPYTSLPSTLPGGGAPHDLVFDFSPLPGGYGWLFPKGDHINIGVGAFAPIDGAPNTQLKSVTRALLLNYAHQKLGVTALDHITGQQLGMGGYNYIPHGRILLVGDAAGLVDPLTGEGIHSAIVSGQAAAAAILSCISKDPGAPCPASGTWDEVATAYARNLRPLQQTLTFSHRAAHAFYAQPERGFKAMRIPFMRSLILKTYADGLPHTALITALAKLTT